MKFRFVFLGPEDDPGQPDAAPAVKAASAPLRYEAVAGGMVRRQIGDHGDSKFVPLANFVARIVSDRIVDDGAEPQRQFGLQAELAGRTITFTVPAAEFGRMGWVLGNLGPEAIVYPGQAQHARAAVQAVSHGIRREQVFVHTGWRKLGGQWVYLHAGGAIGAGGSVPGVQVQLPEQLAGYALRLAGDREQLHRAARASLRLLDLAPDHIGFPLLAAVYRAAVGDTGFSLFMTGRTGVFKSSLAALAQQHFGGGMAAGSLPASFASTANALELLAFHAKDALLVVDDFVPQGRSREAGLQAIAERLFRAVGNHQGRNRMDGHGRVGAAKPPRGLVLATGEEVPEGESLRGRMLIMEVGAGDVNMRILGECQQFAAQGLLAESMGGYVGWLAGRFDEVRLRLQERVRELGRAVSGGAHARTAGIVAELQAGFEQYSAFAAEAGALTPAEKVELPSRCWRALLRAATVQIKYQLASHPGLRYLALLQVALATGQAHVADRRGQVPAEPEAWGWRWEGEGWRPAGVRIGWLDGEDLLLEPSVSYAVAQAVAGSERIPLSEQSLRSRLHQRGCLASQDQARQTLKVRRRVEGVAKDVLHVRVREFRQMAPTIIPASTTCSSASASIRT